VGGRDGPDRGGLTLPAGDVQMEQDRAPSVLPHHEELAGDAAGDFGDRARIDRGHDDGGGPGSPRMVGRRVYEKGRVVSDEDLEECIICST